MDIRVFMRLHELIKNRQAGKLKQLAEKLEISERSVNYYIAFMKNEMKARMPTERQGQFLAYISQYSLVNGCAPAEADMQRFFQISAPSVHSMVLTLERRGFIHRVPG